MHAGGSPVVVQKSSIDSVIFSVGEFAGPDTARLFDMISTHVDAIREFAFQALDDIGASKPWHEPVLVALEPESVVGCRWLWWLW